MGRHGNCCYGNRTGSYVHADAVHPLSLWRTKAVERSVKRKGSVQRLVHGVHLICRSSSSTLSTIMNLRGPSFAAERPLVATCLQAVLSHFCDLCVQVLDWIENHGEAFLSKHTGVGKSLHRARALQKRHEDFEEVAQVAQFSSCYSCSLIKSCYCVGYMCSY